jgi:hypothetical protein
VRVVCKDLEGHRIHVLAIIVFRKLQLDQVRALHGCAIDGVGSVLLDPWQDVCEVEDGAFGCADWVFEGLQGYRAEVEG